LTLRHTLAHCAAMWLNPDEQVILKYLHQCGPSGASFREICRKASTKDRWKEDERWAAPAISLLKEKSAVITTPSGSYSLPPKEEK
jgi:hypothetical protein